MKSIREKSQLKKSSFSEIYQNPLSYVRAMDKDQLENESNYPAYVAYKNDAKIPQRIAESGMMVLTAKGVSLIPSLTSL
jgi:hypothetical protein